MKSLSPTWGDHLVGPVVGCDFIISVFSISFHTLRISICATRVHDSSFIAKHHLIASLWAVVLHTSAAFTPAESLPSVTGGRGMTFNQICGAP